MPRLALPSALLALLSLAAPAAGDPVPATARLAWVRGDGADTCPDGAWLRGEVARRLRRDPFDDDGPRSVEALVERAPPGWRAVLRVRDREGALLGERTLTHEAASCGPIASASALAVALAVDPDAVIDEPEPARAQPAPRARPRPRPARPITRVAPPPGPALSLGLLVGLSGGLAPGLSPTAGLAGSVGLSERWFVRARLDLAPSRADDDPSFTFGFTRATVTGCGAPWRSSSLSLSLCAGVAGALVHVAVRDAWALEAGDHPWFGGVASAGLQWNPSSRVFVSAEAEASLAMARRSFRLRPDGGEVATQPLVSGGGSVTLGLRTP